MDELAELGADIAKSFTVDQLLEIGRLHVVVTLEGDGFVIELLEDGCGEFSKLDVNRNPIRIVMNGEKRRVWIEMETQQDEMMNYIIATNLLDEEETGFPTVGE